jgi:hypothetical protein
MTGNHPARPVPGSDGVAGLVQFRCMSLGRPPVCRQGVSVREDAI